MTKTLIIAALAIFAATLAAEVLQRSDADANADAVPEAFASVTSASSDLPEAHAPFDLTPITPVESTGAPMHMN